MFTMKTCEICGRQYEGNKYSVCCNDCKLDMYRSIKQKEEKQLTHINQTLVEDVKEATALGMSYGEYIAYPLRRRKRV